MIVLLLQKRNECSGVFAKKPQCMFRVVVKKQLVMFKLQEYILFYVKKQMFMKLKKMGMLFAVLETTRR